ncbi:type II toxin-antitoxin system RelE/ParE family toxin [Cyanobacteria bacterium FACHB-63]|nr:type II toxin-antitoxin system RelE/ParE family toxin [Cyanobacteria bacterium FACHB-63]
MNGYRLSEQAELDYREILAFTLERWGINQFHKYAELLEATFDRLVEMPTLGRQRDDIRLGFYRYRVGQHYIFYRITEETLQIARILHVRRNVTVEIDLALDLDLNRSIVFETLILRQFQKSKISERFCSSGL